MEKRIFRIEIALVVIIVLLITNLVLDLKRSDNNVDSQNVISENSLPEKFDEELQNHLLTNIKNCYNERNYHDFYMLFSKYARMQFEENELTKEFGKLITMTGNVNDYIYSNHELLGKESGAIYYSVVYNTKFDNGKGIITIQIREFKNEIELIGVNLNLKEFS